METSSGRKFWEALAEERPLQIVGAVNAYSAIMAKKLGFKVLYLSGAGVANSSYGIPDIGLTTLDNVLEDVRRILSVVDLPLLVDIDTGWGSIGMMQRAIKGMVRTGVAAVHIEDQVFEKKCGHLPEKQIVPINEMCDRIKAAVDSRNDPHFVVMARTDAFANEGITGVIDRGLAYKEVGADMLFAEAITELNDYREIKKAVGIPLLANITEFGQTPLFTLEELRESDIDIALYPLSANRAMNKAGWKVLEEIRSSGTQKLCLEDMQTREELYQILNYTQ